MINNLEDEPDNLLRPYLEEEEHTSEQVINSKDECYSGIGETIIHVLAKEGCLETLRKILSLEEKPVIEEGKLVEALLKPDKAGWSPLMAAVKADRNGDDIIYLFLTFLEAHATTKDVQKLIRIPKVLYQRSSFHLCFILSPSFIDLLIMLNTSFRKHLAERKRIQSAKTSLLC